MGKSHKSHLKACARYHPGGEQEGAISAGYEAIFTAFRRRGRHIAMHWNKQSRVDALHFWVAKQKCCFLMGVILMGKQPGAGYSGQVLPVGVTYSIRCCGKTWGTAWDSGIITEGQQAHIAIKHHNQWLSSSTNFCLLKLSHNMSNLLVSLCSYKILPSGSLFKNTIICRSPDGSCYTNTSKF